MISTDCTGTDIPHDQKCCPTPTPHSMECLMHDQIGAHVAGLALQRIWTATPTISTDREAERACLEASRHRPSHARLTATSCRPPAVLDASRPMWRRCGLSSITQRCWHIERVTIYPSGEHGPEVEVVARISDLMAYATNDNAAPKGGDCSSTAVVAGTGFEPVTFRL